MNEMFEVHTPPALRLHSSLPLHAIYRCRTDRPASYAGLSIRQKARAFNQPLSFDTSRVWTMQEMFEVHSARALH